MPPTSVTVYRSFRDPVLTLWPHLSRPELLDRWLGKADVEMAVGGDVQASLWNGDVVKGSVLAVAPPNCLDLSWRAMGPDAETRVRIRLEHAGPGTRIRVEQDDPGSDGERRYAESWWREALEAMARSVAESGDAHEWGGALPIVLRAPLARTAADVWPLLSTAEGLEKWLAGAEHFEPVPGGAFRFISRFKGAEIVEEGRVVAIEPERLVALDWEWIGQGWEAPTRVELRLEPDPSGAALVLAHSGFGALGPERRLDARRNYASAWRDVLYDLRRLVAPGPSS
jgi:uncharacterized protein YndB with AHSA1/START domain